MVYFFHLIVPTPVVVPTLENNHSDTEDFSKPKIIWGEISDKSKFAFDFLGEYIPEATSFYMKGECIEYLLSALNSSDSSWQRYKEVWI